MKTDCNNRPRGKESTKVRKSQIKGKESENSYQELKRSQKDRNPQTHGNCIEIFRLTWLSFSIVRELKIIINILRKYLQPYCPAKGEASAIKLCTL